MSQTDRLILTLAVVFIACVAFLFGRLWEAGHPPNGRVAIVNTPTTTAAVQKPGVADPEECPGFVDLLKQHMLDATDRLQRDDKKGAERVLRDALANTYEQGARIACAATP